jgi:hypothetical protein
LVAHSSKLESYEALRLGDQKAVKLGSRKAWRLEAGGWEVEAIHHRGVHREVNIYSKLGGHKSSRLKAEGSTSIRRLHKKLIAHSQKGLGGYKAGKLILRFYDFYLSTDYAD